MAARSRRDGSQTSTTSPPRPPSPPSGPPRGTWASRLNEMTPLPPAPASTWIFARSWSIGRTVEGLRGAHVPERVDQLRPGLGGDRLLRDPAERPERGPHLLEVDAARRALAQVALESLEVGAGEPPLEVLGHQLYELL